MLIIQMLVHKSISVLNIVISQSIDLRLAIRLLLRPIPRHFSRWGAKREAAILRLQLGHTHSLFFHWLYTCPKMSTPGWSTISTLERACSRDKFWKNASQALGIMNLCIFVLHCDWLTKILHTFLVRIIQEEIALFDCPVHLKAQP